MKYALTAAVAFGLLIAPSWAKTPGEEAQAIVAAEPKAGGIWIAGDNGVVMHVKSGLKCPAGDTDYGDHNHVLRLKSISVDDTAGNRATCYFDVVVKNKPDVPPMKLAISSEHQSIGRGEPLDRARDAFVAIHPGWRPDTAANSFNRRKFGGKFEMKTTAGVYTARVFSYRHDEGGKGSLGHVAAGAIGDWILILAIEGPEAETDITTAETMLMLSLWSDVGADVLETSLKR